MKAPLLSLALVLSTGSILTAAEVQRGASLEEVRATLGVPRGQLHVAGRQVLYYERGEVELQNGRLTRVALRSAEEHVLLVTREERLRGEREIRRAQLRAEGAALRERKLADPAFQAAPVAYQVAFWEDFARRYPEVSCVEPLTIARLRFNEQIEARRQREEQANRLTEMEERVAAAERQQVYYAVRSFSPRYERSHCQTTGLGPITYTFFDSPLPPYTTPSGNPAGNLTSPFFNVPVTHATLSGQSEPGWPRWEPVDQGPREDRSDRSHGRGFGAGAGLFRERM